MEITNRMLGTRLRGFRLVKGVSLEVLSQETKIPVASLEIYEQGRRMPGGLRMVILMSALGVIPSDLLEDAPLEVSA